MLDRALGDLHRRRSGALSPRNAQTEPYPSSCGSSFWLPWLSSLLSPSNGSHSCSGSLYGASTQSGLGGRGLGFLATSCSIGEPLANCAFDGASGALCIV